MKGATSTAIAASPTPLFIPPTSAPPWLWC